MKKLNHYFTSMSMFIFFFMIATSAVDIQAQNPSAIMDLESTTQGLLVPRMTSAERMAIATPAQGLLVYDTDRKSFWYFQNSIWGELASGELSDADGDTKVEVERISDNDIVNIKVADEDKLTIEATKSYFDGNVGFGTANPLTKISISPYTLEPKITLHEGDMVADHYGFGISSAQLNYHVQSSTKSHVFYAGGRNGDGTELVRIHGDGNIGIGAADPLSRLSISPTLTEPKITLWDGGDIDNHLGFGISPEQLNYHLKTITNSHVFYAEGKNGDGIELMRIRGNGHVGIGTSSPQTQLHIEGGSDASLIDNSGFMVLGPTNGTNMVIDNNEIIARINGNPGRLLFQAEGGGGHVVIGGATAAFGHTLSVHGKIACEEVLVELSGNWPDYVFDANYQLKTLAEVKEHIDKNGHLPGVPSAKEVEENGIKVAEMNKVLMEKIEELTLYILEQEERLRAIEDTIK